MSEKIVYNPTQDKTLKPKRKEKPIEADEHTEEVKPEKTPFINKYGFLHINGDLAKHLGVEFGKDKGKNVPVTIEKIEGGFIVRKAGAA